MGRADLRQTAEHSDHGCIEVWRGGTTDEPVAEVLEDRLALVEVVLVLGGEALSEEARECCGFGGPLEVVGGPDGLEDVGVVASGGEQEVARAGTSGVDSRHVPTPRSSVAGQPTLAGAIEPRRAWIRLPLGRAEAHVEVLVRAQRRGGCSGSRGSQSFDGARLRQGVAGGKNARCGDCHSCGGCGSHAEHGPAPSSVAGVARVRARRWLTVGEFAKVGERGRGT